MTSDLKTEADIAEDIRHPDLLRLYGYWREKRGDRPYPGRRDIDPLEFPYVLGHLMLIDVLREPLRFRVRLHGARMVDRAGYDLTGKLLDELPVEDYRDYVLRRCKSVAAGGAPVIVQRSRLLEGVAQDYEALWLPFAEDGTTITMLLCALIYDDRP